MRFGKIHLLHIKTKFRHKTFVPTPLEVGNENAYIQTLGAGSSACSPGSGATPLEVE